MAERSCGLNGKPERQTLLEVQDYFDFPSPGLVEKDPAKSPSGFFGAPAGRASPD
jgi:hypothetical protein